MFWCQKMRIFVVVITFCFILPYNLGIDLINQDLGDLHFHAKAGSLPLKYFPLTEKDEQAAEKIEGVMDLIQLVPKIDPLKRAGIKPIDINVRFLLLKGQANMMNIVIAGVKSLIVKLVEVRLQNLRIDLNISLPSIYFEGDFSLQAKWGLLPVSCSTSVGVILKGMDISVSAGGLIVQAQPVGEVLQITSADIRVDIQDVLFNLTNLKLGGAHKAVSSAVTQLISTGGGVVGGGVGGGGGGGGGAVAGGVSGGGGGGGSQTGNIFDRILKTALKFINKELLKVSIDVFKSFLL